MFNFIFLFQNAHLQMMEWKDSLVHHLIVWEDIVALMTMFYVMVSSIAPKQRMKIECLACFTKL